MEKHIPPGTEIFDINMAQSAHIANLNMVWEDALNLSTQLNYKKYAIIPHEKHQGVYYIKEGKVKLSYISPNGQERIALTYDIHSIFNEARVFSGYQACGFFTCLTDVKLYLFPKELVQSSEFIQKYPLIIKNLLFTMGAKILLHYSFLSEMGTGKNIVHVSRLILSLSANHDNALTFPAQMTQQEVCDLFGIHRTTLARILRKLKDMGAISVFTAHKVVISNYNLLVTLASQ